MEADEHASGMHRFCRLLADPAPAAVVSCGMLQCICSFFVAALDIVALAGSIRRRRRLPQEGVRSSRVVHSVSLDAHLSMVVQ